MLRAVCRLSFVVCLSCSDHTWHLGHVTKVAPVSPGKRFWLNLVMRAVCRFESKILRRQINQDKKTEKIEMLQSYEALLQKRREQAQARRNTETSEQRRIRLQRKYRQRAAEMCRRTEQLPNENNACKLLKNGCRRSESTELYNNRKF